MGNLELQRQYIMACSSGDINLVSELYQQLDDPLFGDNAGFRTACRDGQLNIVKFLSTQNKKPDIHACDDDALFSACFNQHVDIIDYLLNSEDLLEHADLTSKNYYSFSYSCKLGNIKVIKYLHNYIQKNNLTNFQEAYFNGLKYAIFSNKKDVISYLILETNMITEENLHFLFTDYNFLQTQCVPYIRKLLLEQKILNEISFLDEDEGTKRGKI